MSAVYAVIANHKRVTRKGIIHATNLPEDKVDAELQRLLDEGRIKMKDSYQDGGETVNMPVYYPKRMYKQSKLFTPLPLFKDETDESDLQS